MTNQIKKLTGMKRNYNTILKVNFCSQMSSPVWFTPWTQKLCCQWERPWWAQNKCPGKGGERSSCVSSAAETRALASCYKRTSASPFSSCIPVTLNRQPCNKDTLSVWKAYKNAMYARCSIFSLCLRIIFWLETMTFASYLKKKGEKSSTLFSHVYLL